MTAPLVPGTNCWSGKTTPGTTEMLPITDSAVQFAAQPSPPNGRQATQSPPGQSPSEEQNRSAAGPPTQTPR